MPHQPYIFLLILGFGFVTPQLSHCQQNTQQSGDNSSNTSGAPNWGGLNPVERYVIKIRMDLPYLSMDLYNGKPRHYSKRLGGGASFSIEIPQYANLIAEVGGNKFKESSRIYIGGGLIPTFADRRVQGRGWVWSAGGQLGYQYFQRECLTCQGLDGQEKSHMIAVTGALDATRWWSEHIGFTMKLSALGGFPVTKETNNAWEEYGPSETDVLLTISYSLGIGF